MKNILLGFGLLAVLALAGCQGSKDKEVEVSTNTDTKQEVSVEVDGEKVDVSINEAEKEEPTKVVSALVVPKIEYYHGETCPHCLALKAFLPEVEKMYPGLMIEEYEVWNNPANAEKGRQRLAGLGEKFEGVPSIIIGEEVISGFSEPALLALMKKHYGEPVQ